MPILFGESRLLPSVHGEIGGSPAEQMLDRRAVRLGEGLVDERETPVPSLAKMKLGFRSMTFRRKARWPRSATVR